jgi:RsiW-degrading membrane proteinase PrsW (M82 family)
MIEGVNISLLFYLFVPPLLYAFIIYLTSPYNSVKYKLGIFFMMAGIISVTLLTTIYTIAPSLITTYKNNFLKLYIKIGVLEELVKYIMFISVMTFVNKQTTKKVHPFGYMFYFSLVGLGFAIVENMQYVQMFGEDVLYIRNVTSTIMHMIFGMLFGYWIGLGTIEKRKFEDRSVFGVIMHRHKELKKITYTLIGFTLAVVYHGMYNYNLSTSKESAPIISMIIIIAGLFSCKLLANDLNNKWKNRNT